MSTRFYYKLNDRMFYIKDSSDVLYEDSVRNIWINKRTIHYYECFRGYEASLEGLIKFRDDFKRWIKEILPLMNYETYYCHADAVMFTFHKYCSRQVKSLNVQPITFDECYYMESTNNGGWLLLNPKYKGLTTQTYGYDQPGYYPYLLGASDFKFPIKQGCVYHIDAIDYQNVYYGIYKCDITSDDPDFRNLFTFSSRGYYTHLEVNFAYKYRKKYDVTIKLITDCEHNCLLYEESDLVDTKVIFSNWFTTLSRGKKAFPKNKVVKHLMSSIAGHLEKFNRTMCDDKDVFTELDISHISDPAETEFKLINITCFEERTRYEYIKSSQPYKSNLARLKPFFVSYARNFMVNLVISEGLVKNLIRAHTDNISLDIEHDFTHLSYYPIAEDKTTGLIKWSHVNCYEDVNKPKDKGKEKSMEVIHCECGKSHFYRNTSRHKRSIFHLAYLEKNKIN